MFNKNRIVILYIVLFLVLILPVGCSKEEPIPMPTEGVSVTDSIGREIIVPEDAHHLGTIFAASGHIVGLLGHDEDIVCITNGLTRDILFNRACPGVGENPVVKDSGRLNIEEIVRVETDLAFIEKETYYAKGEKEKLEMFGIPYFVVDFTDIDSQLFTIESMGEALGEQEKAAAYVSWYRDMVELVESRVADIPESEKLTVYHSVNEAIRTDPIDSLSTDWIERTGLINVSAHEELEFTDNKYYSSLEQILLWDPDLILCNESGVDEYIRTESAWSSLKAVHDDRVYLLPNGISRWGHMNSIEIPLAMLYTGKIAYPERFEDIDIEEIAEDYYEQFWDYQLTDDELQDILSGKDMRKRKE
ncbi:ABC transporter substrate-binding protein [Clostridia bacterium]|nr:ABC transporter substrate-binding protein [Clostridia bacterium]